MYFDYAATTPVDPRAAMAMAPFLGEKFGNSSSYHSFGRQAKEALEAARAEMAGYLGADPEEIFFTSSATESNNWALKGAVFAAGKKNPHVIISSVEHDCILNSAKWLEKRDVKVTVLSVDKYGLVDPKDVEKAITEDTVIVSVMHGNNEIGNIEPIAEIGKICRDRGVYFHTDAAQTFGKLGIDVGKMDIDLLTASSHKIYGPKGAALLYKRRGVKIDPLIHGGGQESGQRASTANVAAVVGFAKAAELCYKEMQKEAKRLSVMRDALVRDIMDKIPDSQLNGHPTKRLPNNVNVRFKYIEGESIMALLDEEGIAVSTGSACSTKSLEPSHVLMATGIPHEEVHGSIRISLGRWTKESEISRLMKVLPGIVERLREISPFGRNK